LLNDISDSHDGNLRRVFTIADIDLSVYLAAMKRLFLFLAIAIGISGCEKSAVQEDLVILAMTNGQWKMTSFVEGGTDRTADFASYRFKYNTNNTVDAIRNGLIEKSGTWNGSASTMSIFAEFPNALQPLIVINGTWNITRNGWTFVEANQTVNGQLKTLRLDKD
jgi:hypothetical protein